MTRPVETRERTVTLPEAAGTAGRLQEALRPLAAVETIDIHGRECRIRYRFPEITFNAIWTRIQPAIGKPFPFLSRLRHDLIAFMEDNERDGLLYPGGWHHYVDRVHSRRFDPLHTGGGAQRRRPWQQYSGRRRGTTA